MDVCYYFTEKTLIGQKDKINEDKIGTHGYTSRYTKLVKIKAFKYFK